MWAMCKFHDSNGNGLGDIWWTDKLFYFIPVFYDNIVICLCGSISKLNYYYYCLSWLFNPIGLIS